jgi:hypothetical protein
MGHCRPGLTKKLSLCSHGYSSPFLNMAYYSISWLGTCEDEGRTRRHVDNFDMPGKTCRENRHNATFLASGVVSLSRRLQIGLA